MERVELQCELTSAQGTVPKKQTIGSAGYDLYSSETITIPAKRRARVGTCLKLSIPLGYYGRIAPRSSLSLKYIDVCAGVIDTDYRGEVEVLLHNHSDEPFEIKAGERIAQLVVERILDDQEITMVAGMEGTERGDGGFGSTGR